MEFTAAELDTSTEGVIRIAGDLTFQTVPALREPLVRALVACNGSCRIDLESVGRVDSSALSLWLVCQREAGRQGIELTLVHPPEGFRSIADLVGLDGGWQ